MSAGGRGAAVRYTHHIDLAGSVGGGRYRFGVSGAVAAGGGYFLPMPVAESWEWVYPR